MPIFNWGRWAKEEAGKEQRRDERRGEQRAGGILIRARSRQHHRPLRAACAATPRVLLKRMTRELFNAPAMCRDGNKQNRSRAEMRRRSRRGAREIGPEAEPMRNLRRPNSLKRKSDSRESRHKGGKNEKNHKARSPSSPFSPFREIRGVAPARRKHLSPLRVNIPDRYRARRPLLRDSGRPATTQGDESRGCDSVNYERDD